MCARWSFNNNIDIVHYANAASFSRAVEDRYLAFLPSEGADGVSINPHCHSKDAPHPLAVIAKVLPMPRARFTFTKPQYYFYFSTNLCRIHNVSIQRDQFSPPTPYVLAIPCLDQNSAENCLLHLVARRLSPLTSSFLSLFSLYHLKFSCLYVVLNVPLFPLWPLLHWLSLELHCPVW